MKYAHTKRNVWGSIKGQLNSYSLSAVRCEGVDGKVWFIAGYKLSGRFYEWINWNHFSNCWFWNSDHWINMYFGEYCFQKFWYFFLLLFSQFSLIHLLLWSNIKEKHLVAPDNPALLLTRGMVLISKWSTSDRLKPVSGCQEMPCRNTDEAPRSRGRALQWLVPSDKRPVYVEWAAPVTISFKALVPIATPLPSQRVSCYGNVLPIG